MRELPAWGRRNLQVLGATSEDLCEYYERGLLGPKARYDITPPYLNAPCDPFSDGFVSVPQTPGLGYEINWDYIHDHRVTEPEIEPVAPLHPC